MIRSGGENIYPAEVQGALAEHHYVSAVAVIGVPHARYIEVGCAVIVPALDASRLAEASVLQEFQEFLDHRLASYKRPKHYVFVSELPLGAAGKLQERLLRSQYAALGSTV
jgi:fatty-acyl-CoA synthase